MSDGSGPATATTASPHGGTLAWTEYGRSDGPPVFLFHGTPGSRLDHDPFERPLDARVIAPDRPGYGHSTHQPGRRLMDWPADVVAIADALGIEQFCVVGISGGGPHALACAAGIGADRLRRAGTVCGLGPFDREGATEGMQPMNVMFHETALTNPAAVLEIGEAMAAGIRADVDAFLDGSGDDLPDVDREIMREPAVRSMMAASMTEAVRQGGRAFAEEMIMFSQPWGIPFGEITVPVRIWHGTLDRNVPVSHAEYVAAQIPTATLQLLEGEGHMTLAMRHSPSFLEALLT